MSQGKALSALLISSTEWVQRRVQTLDHTTPGRVKIQETLDLRIPEQEVIEGSADKVILPIAILPKGVLRSWWVLDDHGVPLSVVKREDSSHLVKSMLREVLQKAGVEYEFSGIGHERLLGFVDNGENTSSVEASELLSLCRRFTNSKNLAGMQFVKDLIHVVESSWVVLVEVPRQRVGGRMILRYGYDLNFLTEPLDINQDNDSYSLAIRDPGFSRSLHVEVHVPPELEVYELSLVNISVDQAPTRRHTRVIGESAVPNSVVHIQNDSYVPRFSVTNLEFRLRPSMSGIRQFTDAALATVTIATMALLVLRLTGGSLALETDWRTHTTAAVILALPALLLSWIARAPEPEVVRRAFHRLRLVNIFMALSIFSMAAALSTLWKPLVWNFLWYIPVICCVMGLTLRYLEHAVRTPTVFS